MKAFVGPVEHLKVITFAPKEATVLVGMGRVHGIKAVLMLIASNGDTARWILQGEAETNRRNALESLLWETERMLRDQTEVKLP